MTAVLLSACNGSEGTDRQSVAGGDAKKSPSTTPSAPEESPAEQTGGIATDGEGDTGGGAESGQETDSGSGSTGPVSTDVGFTCGERQIQIKEDDGPVKTFDALEFPTTDTDETINGGIFGYFESGKDQHSISFFAAGKPGENGQSPGDTFGGSVTLYRTDKELQTCTDQDNANYFKYIAGNDKAPFRRHIEGVAVDLYDNPDCTGTPVIKMFRFCIHAINEE